MNLIKNTLLFLLNFSLLPEISSAEDQTSPADPAIKQFVKAQIPCDIHIWDGVWQTNWGVITLHFDDGIFSGNYGPSAHEVHGHFEPKSPCVLEGRWQHTNSQANGRFSFCLTGPNSFAGNWSWGDTDPNVAGSPWHGKRSSTHTVTISKKNSITRLELQQAKHRAKLQKEHQAGYRELLQAQFTEIEALRQKYVKQGNAQKIADATRMLAELRRLTDYKFPKEKKKRFVESIKDAKPAMVNVMLLKSEILQESIDKEQGRWARVPKMLVGASIFATPTTGSNGIADFKVTKGGRIYLALNYDYQGNSGGGWTEERWMPEDFIAAGWTHVRGAQMVAWSNRTYSIFTRRVKKGDHFRLRCNKYEPPYVILLDSGKAANTEDN